MKLKKLIKEGTDRHDVMLKHYKSGKFKGNAVAFFLSDKAHVYADRAYWNQIKTTDSKGNPMLGFPEKVIDKFLQQMRKGKLSVDRIIIESVIKEEKKPKGWNSKLEKEYTKQMNYYLSDFTDFKPTRQGIIDAAKKNNKASKDLLEYESTNEAYTPEYETHTTLHKNDIPSVSKYKKTDNGIVYQKGHRVVGPDGVGEIIKYISDDTYSIGIYKDGTTDIIKKIKAPMWVSEGITISPSSKTFLKGMKKINIKPFADKWMPGNTHIWYDSKSSKFYFVDYEGDYMELKNETTLKELYKFLKSKSIKTEAVDKNEPEVITQLRAIVKNHQHDKVKDPKSGKKLPVDLFSASAVIAVYDGVSKANKEKFVGFGLPSMIRTAFKMVK